MSSVWETAAVAAGSSLLTVLVLWLIGRRFLDRRLSQVGDEIASRVRAAVEEGAEAEMPTIGEGVRSGLDQSVEHALPTVRAEVAAGVRDGAGDVGRTQVEHLAGQAELGDAQDDMQDFRTENVLNFFRGGSCVFNYVMQNAGGHTFWI